MGSLGFEPRLSAPQADVLSKLNYEPLKTIKGVVYKFKSGDLMEKNICSTCGSHIMAKNNFVQFDCPECGKFRIVRCKSCKDHSNKYRCSECDFVGP